MTSSGLPVPSSSSSSVTAARTNGRKASIAGGVKAETIGSVREAGAVVAVAGGAIYGASDPGAAAAELKKRATH